MAAKTKIIVTHPDNLHHLRQRMTSFDPIQDAAFSVAGMAIQTSRNLPKTIVEWRPPPNTACIEYEESDHVWLRGLGFGSYVDTGRPLFMEVDPELFDLMVYGRWMPPAPIAIRSSLQRRTFF